MHFILALCWTLCALVTLTSAAEYIACTPDQYDTAWGATTGWSAPPNTTGASQGTGHFYYDYTNRRQVTTADMFDGKTKVASVLILELYQTGKRYMVDLMKDTCKITELTDPFFKNCVPKDATPVGEFEMGLKPNSMKANAYSYVMKGMQVTSTVAYIANGEIVLVSNVITGGTPTYSFMKVEGFLDFAVGLRNTTVFEIPEQCKKEAKTQTVLRDLLRKV